MSVSRRDKYRWVINSMDPDVVRTAKVLATARGSSIAEIVADAIYEYAKEHESWTKFLARNAERYQQ